MIINQAARFNFGFASNMLLLLWCVFGGLLLHMLEANFLTILLKPVYEKSVDTAQDIIDRGLTVIYTPGAESAKKMLMNSPDKVLRTSLVHSHWSSSYITALSLVESFPNDACASNPMP